MLNEPLNFVMDYKEIKSVGRRNFLNVKLSLMEKDINFLNHNCLPKRWKILPICKNKILLCNKYTKNLGGVFAKPPLGVVRQLFISLEASWLDLCLGMGVYISFLTLEFIVSFQQKEKKRLIDPPPLLHLLFDLIQ